MNHINIIYSKKTSPAHKGQGVRELAGKGSSTVVNIKTAYADLLYIRCYCNI